MYEGLGSGAIWRLHIGILLITANRLTLGSLDLNLLGPILGVGQQTSWKESTDDGTMSYIVRGFRIHPYNSFLGLTQITIP